MLPCLFKGAVAYIGKNLACFHVGNQTGWVEDVVLRQLCLSAVYYLNSLPLDGCVDGRPDSLTPVSCIKVIRQMLGQWGQGAGFFQNRLICRKGEGKGIDVTSVK